MHSSSMPTHSTANAKPASPVNAPKAPTAVRTAVSVAMSRAFTGTNARVSTATSTSSREEKCA